jgi:hypothetical protein
VEKYEAEREVAGGRRRAWDKVLEFAIGIIIFSEM